MVLHYVVAAAILAPLFVLYVFFKSSVACFKCSVASVWCSLVCCGLKPPTALASAGSVADWRTHTVNPLKGYTGLSKIFTPPIDALPPVPVAATLAPPGALYRFFAVHADRLWPANWIVNLNVPSKEALLLPGETLRGVVELPPGTPRPAINVALVAVERLFYEWVEKEKPDSNTTTTTWHPVRANSKVHSRTAATVDPTTGAFELTVRVARVRRIRVWVMECEPSAAVEVWGPV